MPVTTTPRAALEEIHSKHTPAEVRELTGMSERVQRQILCGKPGVIRHGAALMNLGVLAESVRRGAKVFDGLQTKLREMEREQTATSPAGLADDTFATWDGNPVVVAGLDEYRAYVDRHLTESMRKRRGTDLPAATDLPKRPWPDVLAEARAAVDFKFQGDPPLQPSFYTLNDPQDEPQPGDGTERRTGAAVVLLSGLLSVGAWVAVPRILAIFN